MKKLLILSSFLLIAIHLFGQQYSELTTIILVRHAER